MAIRQRAVLAEEKEERREAILDAAEALLGASGRVANMAEVADAAGLAKGTVYLYFPSKEALLFALHERNLDQFFTALRQFLEPRQPVTIAGVVGIIQTHLVNPPTFLPLAACCLGSMATGVPSATAAVFRERMSAHLAAAGASLERHFPTLGPGAGVRLLRHSYALTLGLWQMASREAEAGGACAPRPGDYREELDQALEALWLGATGATSRVDRPPAAG